MTENMTREAWLNSAVEFFRPRFEEIGMPLPEKVHVSVGFPKGTSGESKYVMAICFIRAVSTAGVNEIFISPEYDDAATVLATLLHELIHAADDGIHGHRGAFAEAATRLGLTGKMTETVPGVTLAFELITIAESLGTYPHKRTQVFEYMEKVKRVTAAMPKVPSGSGIVVEDEPRNPTSGRTGQKTYMLKLTCPSGDGFSVRTTAKMLTIGYPSCPCGQVMCES
jgi:hypothetical protein